MPAGCVRMLPLAAAPAPRTPCCDVAAAGSGAAVTGAGACVACCSAAAAHPVGQLAAGQCQDLLLLLLTAMLPAAPLLPQLIQSVYYLEVNSKTSCCISDGRIEAQLLMNDPQPQVQVAPPPAVPDGWAPLCFPGVNIPLPAPWGAAGSISDPKASFAMAAGSYPAGALAPGAGSMPPAAYPMGNVGGSYSAAPGYPPGAMGSFTAPSTGSYPAAPPASSYPAQSAGYPATAASPGYPAM